LPNGNLLIQGSRTVGLNAEAQTVTLTGTVRPVDIQTGNTVSSQMVAGAKISYSGKGPVGEVQHDGLVRKIFKYLF
jgi:flagellar L-ring protein precursor FlgH